LKILFVDSNEELFLLFFFEDKFLNCFNYGIIYFDLFILLFI